jgi:dolichol kinase
MNLWLFFPIITATVVYYTWHRRFDVVYSAFLSGMVGAVLKYMVSATLSFGSAPPALDVMVFSTLAVFNGWFWLATLAAFVLGAEAPLAAVSGLLLGFGLGKWHSRRRGQLLLEEGEIKRKVIHSAGGVVVALLPFFLPRDVSLLLFALGATLTFMIRFLWIPMISDIFKETKRDEEWLGKGFFWFMLGSLLPIYLGQPWILLVVAVGDGLSTLIGRFFGYTPVFGKKSLEGTFAGFLGAWAIARHFYAPSYVPVLIYVVAELVAPIDDNFAIPVALSALYL